MKWKICHSFADNVFVTENSRGFKRKDIEGEEEEQRQETNDFLFSTSFCSICHTSQRRQSFSVKEEGMCQILTASSLKLLLLLSNAIHVLHDDFLQFLLL